MHAAIDRIDRVVDESSRGAVAREEGVWAKVSQEIGAVRSQLEQDRTTRERDDEEKMRLINDGIAFIKDGKETWLRMFDYKMMPVQLKLDESEARSVKAQKDTEQKIGDVVGKMQLLEGSLEEERRVREDEIACLSEDLVKEAKTREATEEQMSRLLEQTVMRLEELRHQ